MRIVTLLENESSTKGLKSTHGLSLYIETASHRILFDVGPNKYIIKNAKKLGIDLALVDMVVLSHGHNDHGNGLSQFMKINSKAMIYMSKHATNEFVVTQGKTHINIGIKVPKSRQRIQYVKENLNLGHGVHIITDVPYKQQVIQDQQLMTYEKGRYRPDHFDHEMYLLVQEEDKVCLFTGCSHKGIENIIDSIEATHKYQITHIFGGYHLHHYNAFNFKETDYLSHLGKKFNQRDNSTFYSCHCTGEDAFFELQIHLRDNIRRLKTGDTVII